MRYNVYKGCSFFSFISARGVTSVPGHYDSKWVEQEIQGKGSKGEPKFESEGEILNFGTIGKFRNMREKGEKPAGHARDP